MKSLESESPEADIKKNIQKGRDFRKKGNFDDAINSFENALFFYKELQYDQLLCEILYELGTLNALKGNNEKALNYFQKSADVFKERKDFQGLSLALGNLASINYYKKSDFEKALEY